MTTLAQRPGAESAPVAVGLPGTFRLTTVQVKEAPVPDGLPAWSTLSWEERADFVARYCL